MLFFSQVLPLQRHPCSATLGAPNMEQKRSVRDPRGTKRLRKAPEMSMRGTSELQEWPTEHFCSILGAPRVALERQNLWEIQLYFVCFFRKSGLKRYVASF